MTADAADWLAAGDEALRRGRARQALRACERADAGGGDRERILLLRAHAARTLLHEGETLDAIEVAASILAVAPHDRIALEVMSHGARAGWTHEALDALETRVRLEGNAQAFELAARTYQWMREDERALAYASRGTSLTASLIAAQSAARLGRAAEARAALVRAESLADGELAGVARAALQAGCFDLAESLFARAGDASSRAWLAELALWRMELERAVELAQTALETPRAHSVLGGVCVLRGDPHSALAHLERALATPDDSEPAARHWRAEALRKLERKAEAIEELDLAIARCERYFVTARMSRILCIAGDSSTPFTPDTYADLLPFAESLAGPPPARASSGFPSALAGYFEQAFSSLGGNRSELPTRVANGTLTGLTARLNARTAARYHQERIRTRPVAEVLAGFDQLLAEYGEQPTIHCHRGELHLWLGDWDHAARSFERALEIDELTRWAWIGLAAARMYAGDDESAARTFTRGIETVPPPGRTIYVYRGELAFRQGQFDDAARDLEQSLSMNPERLPALLLLARVDAARGDRESCRARVVRAASAAPSLMRDAARAASNDPDQAARIALSMMRGNRSSSFVTYFTATGAMRFVPPPRIEAVRLATR